MSTWGAENAVSNRMRQTEQAERRERLRHEDRKAAAKAVGRGKRSV